MTGRDAEHRGRPRRHGTANAAAEWAADEAALRGTEVVLAHVKEPSPDALLPSVSREPVEERAQDLLDRTTARLRDRRPD
ncbi:universal stress protein [Streptomyces sp. NPDC079020]|uniref:universal stress protein n=1 Tax=Streptomyces sp. NPDC079020 TaxID=3365722 RepID=UPI0037CCF621